MSFYILNIEMKITFLFAAMLTFLLIFDTTGIMGILLLSFFIHESAHIFAMNQFGQKISRIVFSPIGISIIRNDAMITYKQQILVALAGPVSNILVFLICILLYSFHVFSFFLYLSGVINLAVAIFNLLPVASFDGRCVLYSVLSLKKNEESAEKATKIVSLILLTFMVAGGIIYLLLGNKNPTLLITASYMAILEITKLNR